MKKIILLSLLAFSMLVLHSCKDEEDNNMTTDFNYSVQIMSPDATDKNVGDSIHFHINFESLAGETIHHINVKIYNKDNPDQIVYNMPSDAHLHDEDGYHEHHDDLILSNENGVMEHTDWILEAKIWAHEAGMQEVRETVEFHVHP